MTDMERYLKCTKIIDCDNETIKNQAQLIVKDLETDKEKAVALYYFVRDEINHNPYAPASVAEDHMASLTLERGNGQCQHKSALLVALCRAVGIPSRVGYVDVRDHLLSEKFRQMVGGDNLLIQHGYAEIYIDGKWLHVSPAYGLSTCEKGGFVPVDFDGTKDAKDSSLDKEGNPHIEHVKDHGTFDDYPWDFIESYRKEFVIRIGREWNEYMDNVENHTVG